MKKWLIVIIVALIIFCLILIFRPHKQQIIEVPVFRPDSTLIAKYDSLLKVDSILSDSVKNYKILYEKSKVQKPVKYYYSDSDLVEFYQSILPGLRSKKR